ncbi:TIM barrel protein [Sphingomonas sp. YL-JM2C]
MTITPDRLGIDMLSVLGMPPVAFVHLAADLKCRHISLGLSQAPVNPLKFAPWSLRDDRGLRRDLLSALAERDVQIRLGEGFAIRPGMSTDAMERDLDLMAELGARAVGSVAMEPDHGMMVAGFVRLARLAADRNLDVVLEFVPGLPVETLPQAVKLIAETGQKNLRLLIDAMHFFRGGGTADEIRELPLATIGYVQLCDAPLDGAGLDYMSEAMSARRIPGEGAFPLREFVAALPAEIPLGLEIPNTAACGDEGQLRTWIASAVAAVSRL